MYSFSAGDTDCELRTGASTALAAGQECVDITESRVSAEVAMPLLPEKWQSKTISVQGKLCFHYWMSEKQLIFDL